MFMRIPQAYVVILIKYIYGEVRPGAGERLWMLAVKVTNIAGAPCMPAYPS